MNGLNRDVAIVVIAVVALVLVSYQAGYIPFADDDTSEKVDSEPVNETVTETSSSSLDEIHPLASTCLTHGGLTRHDHMYLYIQVNGESVTIPENTGVTLKRAMKKVQRCMSSIRIRQMGSYISRCKPMNPSS